MLNSDKIRTEEGISGRVLTICENNLDIKTLLHLLQLKDYDAYIHSLRVATLMDEIFTADDAVIKGALLHDIGKLELPLGLTNSPMRLSAKLKDVVKAHTLLGAEILKYYPDVIQECALYHHDKTNDTDYIKQLRACDIYDAVTHPRPYREKCFTSEEAIGELKKQQVSEDIISAFKMYLPKDRVAL